jgi:ketosteroid isomerase-like protein
MKISSRWMFTVVLAASTSLGVLAADEAEDAVRKTQARRFQAMIAVDLDALGEVLADDLTYTHSSGRVDTKKEMIDALASGRSKYKVIRPEEVRVRMFEGTAVITGRAHVDVTSEGRDLSLELRFTDVYVQKGGRWQMVAWQSTRIQ